MELTDFLRARCDDDERVARAAASYSAERGYSFPTDDSGTYGVLAYEHEQHAARHSPARVLAEVDAKRRIMAIHHPKKYEGMGGLPQICDGCGYGGICDDPITEDINDCPILRALAVPHAEHPDYDPAWTPE